MLPEDMLSDVLNEALCAGGEFAEVFVEERQSMSASMDDRKVEELSAGYDKGAGIRVVVGSSTGFAHTSDLSEKALLEAARVASAVARGFVGQQSIAVGLKSEKVAGGGRDISARQSGAESIYSIHKDVPKQQKVELLLEADEASRSSGTAISQVSVAYSDSRRRILVCNSDGLLREDEDVRTRFSVNCVANGDTGLQTGYETVARRLGFELFDLIEVTNIAEKAAGRALVKLNARSAPSGELPVVLAAGSGGILFHEACGHGLEADHIQKGASVYCDRIGEQVASGLITLIDDGTLSEEWGGYGIDDEGHPASRSILIENGVLCDYMWDFLRSNKGPEISGKNRFSGNGRRQSYKHLPMVRMTNTYVAPGTDDPEEIIAQTKYGIYVAKLGGGQVNTATGDFVFGTTEAYMIEDGRITYPLRDANLIGNGPEVLKRIDCIGRDFGIEPGTCGKDGQNVPVGCGQPTLRISAITVGGSA